MNKPILVIKTHPRDYSGLIALGESAYKALLTNPYITSTSPPISVLRTRIDETTDCLGKWGKQKNHGSYADLENLRNSSVNLSLTLKSICQSVQASAQEITGAEYNMMRTILASTGFPLKKTKAPQGLLEAVMNFRTIFRANLNINQVMLKWDKPNNVTAIGNVKTYKIYMGTTYSFPDSELIASVTKTSLIYSNNSDAPQKRIFWIVPVNSAGDGAISDAITVRLLNP